MGYATDPIGCIGTDVRGQAVMKSCDVRAGNISEGNFCECWCQMLIELLLVVGNGASTTLLFFELCLVALPCLTKCGPSSGLRLSETRKPGEFLKCMSPRSVC